MSTASPLAAATPRAALDHYEGLAGAPTPAEIGKSMEKALTGAPDAVASYLDLSRRLLDVLLRDSGGSVAGAGTGGRDRRGGARPPLLLLELSALEAPFSAWVREYGSDDGAILFWIARLREILEGRTPLVLPKRGVSRESREAREGPRDAERFVTAALGQIAAPETPGPVASALARVKELFELSTTELAALFGVSRQAAAAWLERGVPPERRAKLQTVLNLAELLERKLERTRIAGAVRKRSPALGERSMLEAIAAGEEQELLERTRRLFDWSSAA